MSLIYLFLFIPFITFTSSNHIKGLDDSILFRVSWPGFNEYLLNSPDYDIFEISTTNNERFKCLVPRNYGESDAGPEKYVGPNPLNLLMPLFKKQLCTIRHESFWTYEVCHGMNIKQYHEEREGTSGRFQEYLLGTSNLEDLLKQAKSMDDDLLSNPNLSVQAVKVEGVDVPYFEVKYNDGSLCDLTGNPRITRVLYVCFEDGRPAVYSVKETFTCEYEIVILTPHICVHPFYKPTEVEQTDLPCVSLSDGVKKPENYVQIEAESLKLRTHGTVLTGDLSGGSVRLEIVEDGSDRVYEDEDGYRITEFISGGGQFGHETLKGPLEVQDHFSQQPSIDTKLVEDFLNGDYCLEGGFGWWKYSFCYGKLVQQYHEEKDGSKFVILLGTFDVKKHEQWIEENPNKKFSRGKTQVSHFYSGGDHCENGKVKKPRQVEVKLKCKPSQSPSAVTLFLLEPNMCEYVLGVETPLVCPLLDNADELGLFTLNRPKSSVSESAELDALGDEDAAVPLNVKGDLGDAGELQPKIAPGSQKERPVIKPSPKDGDGEDDSWKGIPLKDIPEGNP